MRSNFLAEKERERERWAAGENKQNVNGSDVQEEMVRINDKKKLETVKVVEGGGKKEENAMRVKSFNL